MALLIESNITDASKLKNSINFEIEFHLRNLKHSMGRGDFEGLTTYLDSYLMKQGYSSFQIEISTSQKLKALKDWSIELPNRIIIYEATWMIESTTEYVSFKIHCNKL